MEASRDLSALSVPLVGELVAMDDPWDPYRLIGPAGQPVEGAGAFLRDLQGAGRSATTARSYGMDLLRWFRFLWAVEVPWDRASRIDARDFSRWLQIMRPAEASALAAPERGGPMGCGRKAVRTVGTSAQRDSAADLLRLPPRHRHRAAPQPVPAGPDASR